MSQHGPLLVVSTAARPPFASALDDAFPVIHAAWADASRAVAQLGPAAVLVAWSEAEAGFEALAKQIAAAKPYLPLIAVDPGASLPENAIPFSQSDGNFDRLMARVRALFRRSTPIPPVRTERRVRPGPGIVIPRTATTISAARSAPRSRRRWWT